MKARFSKRKGIKRPGSSCSPLTNLGYRDGRMGERLKVLVKMKVIVPDQIVKVSVSSIIICFVFFPFQRFQSSRNIICSKLFFNGGSVLALK